MNEQWKTCSRNGLIFEDYEVSNLGNIRRIVATKRTKSMELMSPHLEESGYLRIMLRKNKKQYRCSVHGLVLEAFLGTRPENYTIDHIDGNKLNNNINNLEYCTHKENIIRAFKLGLRIPLKGENHPSNKLTQGQVDWIRLTLKEKIINRSDIARLLNVTVALISAIESNKLWNI